MSGTGFSSGGACFPTLDLALADWCSHLSPGSTATSCSGCNSTNSTCSIGFQPSNGSAFQTVSVPVSAPSCEVLDPLADSGVYLAAITALWIAAWAGRALYNFFRLPHHDNS